jgi:integrase/recombinase XerD
LQPVLVAGYIEPLEATHKATTVKQHLACIRMLFDWLVVCHVHGQNPAHAVRGPRQLLPKVGTTCYDLVIKVLTDLASEHAKKTMGLK